MTRLGNIVAVSFLWFAAGMLHPHSAFAEWYVAGQFGANLADRLSDIRGTGDLSGFRAPDFDLQNSFLYGGKVGTFPGNGWFGVELDAFHSTPHIKNLDDVPGIHMRVTNVGVNLLVRYPGVTFQPYAGIGAGAAIARIGDSATTRGNTDVSSAVNVLLGMRAFITPYVAVYTEYKYNQSTFEFNQAFGPAGGFNGDYDAHILVTGLSYHF
ncbi:MAG: outer membrane beta-barrel protein [Nitrospira sp.]|jgi:opacity protein-like surface antigen|uniref:outer membrane protein n=1 Tax=Nitrospira sp. ND1 TaxID=1658518 RepID=UPI0009BBF90E|nr:outer membrane beta-barrel protein [Nitrospira sp. ND1]MBK7419947.1 outer membrane beta-barrel protein [Nitrospira sp.]MBK7486824.1 outer membrane beta-barrel protein [Nitrospira sp.]MBK8378278.1 outer membrane beta-barrel protein [Nitrospira sp.]MBK9111513.1 outer membrane beta-barrel protein [Nitrospira sp.]MBK9997090.1 outer membrane beta-barrel protein [Nitrospira sp.]